jgi:hypothetical protein
MPQPYQAEFETGQAVKIRDHAALERFLKEWKYHDPLTQEQLPYAGSVTTVAEVGFYHGGDPLYKLVDVPGIWHEECLTQP